jgi:antitoxin YefM
LNKNLQPVNSEPTIIVSSNPEDQAVLLSLSDFQTLEETAYLLSSPANRAHLEKSLQKMKEGQLIELSEEDL